jgi:hypothetical protein
MTKIPASLLSVAMMLLHIFALPVFFLGFILIYDSYWIDEFLRVHGDMTIFNTLMLTCILVGIMCASRIPMTVFRTRLPLSWWKYGLWSFGELFLFSCFAALYMALVYGDYGYFPALGECLRLSFATLSYPYIMFALLFAVIRPDEDTVAEEDLVRFADNTGRLKLVIAHDVILYIEAQENYVSIHYMEGEKMKEYSLRQSMRGIEDIMDKHGIIRCQRSYFVNPRHVKVLRRDKEGFIQAELDIANSKPVPVSPKYYEQLSKML